MNSKTTKAVLFTIWALIMGSYTGCAALFAREVAYVGFSVSIPGDWLDRTDVQKKQLCVERSWGTSSLVIEKMPGDSEYYIKLYRRNSKSEEKITAWYGLHGHGYIFENAGQQRVIFFPNGNYEGWYMEAAIADTEHGARSGFETVIRTLRPRYQEHSGPAKGDLP